MKSGSSFCVPRLLAVLILGAGCAGSPGRVSTPDVDADRAAESALQELDASGDGALQLNELRACPALTYAMAAYDTNNDRQLSEDELAAGIGRWAASKTGAMLLPFRAQLDGRPLAGAEVKLVPVSFLQDRIKGAQGTADSRGAGMLGLAPEDRPRNAPQAPLVSPGLYRVEITHPTQAIPTEFNTRSTLGLETFVAAQNPAGVVWDLRSKKK